jgi:hypothetical protein
MIKGQFWILTHLIRVIFLVTVTGISVSAIGRRVVQEYTCTSILISYGLLYFHTEYHYKCVVSLK